MADLTPRTRSENFLNGEDLEPITRREHFYAGRESELPEGHQEPETREEWFIQKYRGAGDVTVESLAVTENGTYTAPSGKAYSPVSVNVPLPSNAYLLQTIEHESIATFSDGTDNFVKSLEVAIEPQQDLHGYDAPWVGGSGKNKLPINSLSISGGGITATIDRDSNNNVVSITVNGTASGTVYVILNTFTVPSGTYTMSGCPSNGGSDSYRLYDDKHTSWTDNGSGASFTLSEASQIAPTIRIANGYTVNNLKFYPMIESGSSKTTFAPYSNICPISGWDECNVTRCGVNVWDEEWEVGGISNTTGQNTINNSTIRTKNYIPVVPNTQYYINSSKWQFVAGYDADKKFVGMVSYASSGTGYYINVPSNVYYIRIPFSTAYGTTYNHDISINYPSTDTEYHAYNGHTYTISLNGTRYGGKLDVVNGILTPAPYYASYNGETLTGEWISDRDKYEVGATPTIGAQVVNIGASDTPVSIAPTIIKSLQGDNNFFASTGEIELLQYWGKEVS